MIRFSMPVCILIFDMWYDNGWLDKCQFLRRLWVFGAEQQLQREPLAEQSCRDIGSDDAPCDIDIFAGVVKTGESDRVRKAVRVVVHVGLNEVGDIVAGAHKSAWPVFQLIQESVQFFVIGEDINAPGEAVLRPDDELMPSQ